MIWTHKARLHWVCYDFKDIEGDVRVIDNVSHWMLIETNSGEVLHSGRTDHPLDAMNMIKYLSKSTLSKLIDGVNNESTY